MDYNRDNYKKHTTKNLLKRKMIRRLTARLCDTISVLAEQYQNVRILDAGCGEGFVATLIRERLPDAEFLGIDFSEEALEVAKRNVQYIDFLKADIYKLPFKQKCFDIVLCSEVLEHLEKPDDAVRELMRVSRGHILITVPHEPWFCLGNLLVLKNTSRLGNPIDHINHWTYGSFKKFMRKFARGVWYFQKAFHGVSRYGICAKNLFVPKL